MKNFKASDILRPVIMLTLICLITSALLAYTNSLTAPVIEALAVQTANETKSVVLSSAESFDIQKLGDTEYSVGKDSGGTVVGYVFTASAKGYGGDINVMVGVTAEGKVSGVEILELSETPGLGMKATGEDFLNQFIDKIAGIGVNKNNPGENEIKALTGATITSKAVTSAVNTALEYYAEITGGANNG